MSLPAPPPVDLSVHVQRARSAPGPQPEGRVRDVIGVLVEIEGLAAPIGGQLEVRAGNLRLALEVIGFRQGRLLAAPLGPTTGIVPGARVRSSSARRAPSRLETRCWDASSTRLANHSMADRGRSSR